ncbi:MAG: LLM class flavin-dependent oxidoreductase [Pseudomonadota bacterium]
MEFGISCSRLADIDLVTSAEQWGYDFCWATDSPLLRSNPWTILSLAAERTRRIRLGMGVAVPGLRLAPDTASGIASVNYLAPGRAFLGIGTGNTAMRTLGRPPMRVKPFAEYIRSVRGLLDGEEVALTDESRTPRPARFQNLDRGYINIEDRIPIYVGGFGPRAQALAGELGDGLITGIPRGGTVDQALAHVERGAKRTDRALDAFHTTALVNVLVLEPDEGLQSERVINQIGSAVMANVHYLVERHKETGEDPPNYVLPIWEEYLGFHRTREAERQHQALHASHYSFLDPEEARFVTPEMIDTFALVGRPEALCEKLETLERAGLNAIAFIPTDDEKWAVYEAFATSVIARMRR